MTRRQCRDGCFTGSFWDFFGAMGWLEYGEPTIEETRSWVLFSPSPVLDATWDGQSFGGPGVMYGVEPLGSVGDEADGHWLTFLLGAGGSATVSLFGKSAGGELSVALAITSGREGLDVGVVVVTGEPIDEFWVAVNIGLDAFVGGVGADFQELEDEGEAINLVLGPVAAAGFVGEDGRDIEGGTIGVNLPLPPYVGASVTKTNTSVYSYRGAVDTVAGWFCRMFETCAP